MQTAGVLHRQAKRNIAIFYKNIEYKCFQAWHIAYKIKRWYFIAPAKLKQL